MKHFILNILVVVSCLATWSVSAQNTPSCDNGRFWRTGMLSPYTGTSSTYYLPFESRSSYSGGGGSKTIYTRDELAELEICPGSTIYSVGFVANGSCTVNDVYIYLNETPLSILSGTNADTGIVNEMQLVYHTSVLQISEGLNEIQLDTPFEFNGTGNLAIAFVRKGSCSTDQYFKYRNGGKSYCYHKTTRYSSVTGRWLQQRLSLQLGACTPPPSCHVPENLTVMALDSTNAAVSYTAYGDTCELSLCLAGVSANNGRCMMASTSGCTITGLYPGIYYDIYVRSHCGDSITPWSEPLRIHTTGSYPTDSCTSQRIATVIDGTDVSRLIMIQEPLSGNPSDSSGTWNLYSRQDLQDAHILPGSLITSMAYKTYSGTQPALHRVSIYMAESPLDIIGTVADSMPLSQMTLVGYVDVLHESAGWTTLQLDTPFRYSGEGSLMVAIIIDSAITVSYTSQGYYLRANTGRRIWYSYSNGTRTSGCSVGQISMQLGICPQQTDCRIPDSLRATTTENSLTLHWQGDATHYQVVMGPEGFDPDTVSASYPFMDTTTSSQYTFTGLESSTHYQAYVRALCSDVSLWSEAVSTKTHCGVQPLPYTIQFNSADELDSCWTLNGSGRYRNDNTYPNCFFIDYQGIPVALPAFDAPTNKLHLRFRIGTVVPRTLCFGVMSNAYDPTTFVPVDTMDVPLSDSFTGYMWMETDLRNYNGPDGRVAFKVISEHNTSDFRLDDLTVDTIPPCYTPTNLHVDSVSAYDAYVSWSIHLSQPESYQMSGHLRSADFPVSPIPDHTTTNTSLHLQNLHPGYEYGIHLRSICGAGDTSAWGSYVLFTTACGPIDTLPYAASSTVRHNTINSILTKPRCWTSQVTSNRRHFVSQAIDTTLYPMRQLKLTFKTNNHNFEVGLMSDPDDTTTFVPLTATPAVTPANNNRSNYTYYINQNQGDNIAFRGNNSGWLAIDDIRLDHSPCHPVTLLTADSVTDSSIHLIWTENGNAQAWDIIYSDGQNSNTLTSHTPSITIPGLTQNTDYTIRVYNHCGSDLNPLGDTITVRTPFDSRHRLARVQIGPVPPTNNASCYVPIERYDAHSWSQSIYRSDSINVAGRIDTLWFYCTQVGVSTPTDTAVDLYLGHTKQSVAADNTDWIPQNQLTLVKSAANLMAPTSGWYAIPLDNPFFYNGVDNLVFAASRNGSTYSLNHKYCYFDGANGVTLARGNDNDISYANYPDSLAGTRSTQCATVRLSMIEEIASCPRISHLHIDTLIGQDVVIAWNEQGSATRWDVLCYNADSTVVYNFLAQHNPYTLIGLQGNEYYTVKVRPICSAGDTGVFLDSVQFEHITCLTPDRLSVNNITNHSATLSWSNPSEAMEWVLQYSDGVQTWRQMVYDTTITLTQLTPLTNYNFSVQTICGSQDSSFMSAPAYFHTRNANNELQHIITLGDGTFSSTTGSPFNNYYRHGWKQILYDRTLIGVSGYIDTIWFHCATAGDAASLAQNDTLTTIYMGPSPRSSALDNSDWVPLDSLTQVRQGRVLQSTDTGWLAIALEQSYFYDSAQHLCVAISHHCTQYSFNWQYYCTYASNSVLTTRDDDNFAAGEYPGTSTGTLDNYRPNLRLSLWESSGEVTEPCLEVDSLWAERLTDSTISVDWSDTNAQQWIVVCRPAHSDLFVQPDTVTSHPMLLAAGNDTMEVSVCALCDTNRTSEWTTLLVPPLPPLPVYHAAVMSEGEGEAFIFLAEDEEAMQQGDFEEGTLLRFEAFPLSIDTVGMDILIECHFLHWADGNTSNRRYLTLTQDTLLTAVFGCDTIPLEDIDAADEMTLRMYPNPAHKEVTFETSDESLQVTLYDLSGRVAMQSECSTKRVVVINIEALPAGIYIARITTPHGLATQKLIIK